MPSREIVRNSILNLLDLTFMDARARAMPSIYGTAVSTVCDLKCPHCMRESLGIRENALMDPKALEPHIAAMRTARRVSLYGLGEPFLNPRFFEIVKMLKDQGAEITTSSHGMSLKPEIRERILESRLDDINISMDGATKDTFERLRVNAKWDVVTSQVTALSALRRERGAPLTMNLNMTVMRSNVHEVPKMVELAARMGIESVSFSSAVIYKESDLGNSVEGTPIFEKYMEEGRSVAAGLGIPMGFWRQKPVGWEPDAHDPRSAYGCSQLWSTQIIEPDGRMKLCCYIEEDIANVFELGPEGAFNSDELLRQRRALMEGRVRVECQGCVYLRERSPSMIQAQINEAIRQTAESPELEPADRDELYAAIEAIQARKNAMFPLHRHRAVRFDAADGAGAGEGSAAAMATSLPVY